MHGLFSIPLQVFMTVAPPPDPERLKQLETGLDRIARDHDLSDREARTLKDSFVEPFRQEGLAFGPETVQWLMMANRRLLALPPGVVTAGAELQWSTLNLARYAPGMSLGQYLDGIQAEAPTPAADADGTSACAPPEGAPRAGARRGRSDRGSR